LPVSGFSICFFICRSHAGQPQRIQFVEGSQGEIRVAEYLVQLPDRHLLETKLAAAVHRAQEQFQEIEEELPGEEPE
jgi:hypothetical protein